MFSNGSFLIITTYNGTKFSFVSNKFYYLRSIGFCTITMSNLNNQTNNYSKLCLFAISTMLSMILNIISNVALYIEI